MDCKLRLSGVVNDAITDGPGIRFVVFTQGCTHNCQGCHNPGTHDINGGEEKDINELFAQIKRNPLLTGVTFSGGEPFLQSKPLVELARKIKDSGLELAIYTGFTWEELNEFNDDGVAELLRLTDTLIDGRFILSEKTLGLKFRGSKNQRVIDVGKSLESGAVVIDQSDRWN